jgi:glyoxylase-like metal-dependent hydrolase (beta-lactamase superfamily II)
MQTIVDNIYYEDSYAGVNLGAVTLPRGTLLIDAPLRVEDARTWKAALLTQSQGTHRLLVVLDGHVDRTISSGVIKYPIVAHEKTAQFIKNRGATFKGRKVKIGADWEHYPDVKGTGWQVPSITFSKQLEFHWGETMIRIEHHPGPTPGASWIHIPSEKILFVGDAVTPNQPPFLARADLEVWHQTLNELASRRFYEYTILTGRGGTINAEIVREQRKFLKSVRGRLNTMLKNNAEPHETEEMIPALLEKIDYPPEMEAFYTRRLRYGLEQYYRQQLLEEDQTD